MGMRVVFEWVVHLLLLCLSSCCAIGSTVRGRVGARVLVPVFVSATAATGLSTVRSSATSAASGGSSAPLLRLLLLYSAATFVVCTDLTSMSASPRVSDWSACVSSLFAMVGCCE